MNNLKESELLKQNLETIKVCDELLYGKLENFDFSSYEIKDTEIETAQDDTKIIKVIKNEYEWYLNSKYEAIQFTKDWVYNLGKIEIIATIVVYGLGNGSILKELIKTTNDSVIFIIYEPSIDVFLRVMKEIDFSFLEKRAFILVEGINDTYLETVLQVFVTYENLSVCKFVGHPNYWSCFPAEGRSYLLRLQTILKHIDVNKNTKLRMGDAYYKNILMNMKYLTKSCIIDQIQDRVGIDIPRDFPAIIVSAGPSLSKNIRDLKKAKKRAFIIATDSALVGLLKEEIIPDAYVTVDPLKPLNRFEDERIDKIPLICTESARYEAVEKNKDKIIFVNNFLGYGNAFYNKMGHDYQSIDQGGSVATFAYTVAKIIGFRTIIFIGQDLSFEKDKRYYDQAKEWGRSNAILEHNCVEVEDIYGGKVKTTKDMAYYLEWFETQIKNDSHIEVIDATEGGAKINGSNIMKLSLVIQEKCQMEFDMIDYLRNIPEPLAGEDKKQLNELIQEVPDAYNSLYQDVLDGIELYKELIDLLQNENSDTYEMVKRTKKIGEVSRSIESNLVYFHVQHKIVKTEHIALNNLGTSLDEKVGDALQTAGRGMLILEALKSILEEEVLLEVTQVVAQYKTID